jgi:hypothetical protein
VPFELRPGERAGTSSSAIPWLVVPSGSRHFMLAGTVESLVDDIGRVAWTVKKWPVLPVSAVLLVNGGARFAAWTNSVDLLIGIVLLLVGIVVSPFLTHRQASSLGLLERAHAAGN